MAADRVRLRGRHLHRRPRPGRGAGAGAQEGGDARHQAREHLHRGPARGVRPRLRLPDVPRQRGLRGPVPARHLDRAAADRQAPGRDRRKVGADAVAHGATGKGNDQVRFELGLLRAQARRSRSSRRGASGTFKGRDRPHRLRRASTRSRSPRTSAARRRSRSTPTCCTRPPRARCWRIRPSKPPRDRLPAHHLADGSARQGDRDRGRLRAGRRGLARRQGAVAGDAAGASSTSSAATTASAGSTWSRTASSA